MEEDGSDEFYEGKIEIENGTGEWNFPVQKNAELEEVITTISTDQTVASPSLAVDDQTQWEYPEEYGVLNALDEFVEGESVELEISGGEDETVEVKLPVSIVESGQFYIKRNEIDPEYHIEMDVGEETVWTRTEDDDLLGPAEEWVSGEDLRSADHIETETGKYIAAGGLPGRVYIHDAITGDELDEYNPGTGRLKRVLFQSSEGDDPIGLSMGRTGEIHRFAYDFDMEELTGEYLNSTHMYNDILFTYDLTENGWEDVITIRDEEILVSYNEGEEDITPFEKIHSLPHRPNDVSITPEGRFMTACSDRAMVEIFDYVSGSLEYMFNITLEETARKAFGLEYTGDGVMDLVIQNRAGDIEVFTEDEDGNYTTAQHIEVDFSVTDMAIADLNENGLDDLVFTSVHRDSRRSYVYLNHGGEFVEEYDFLMSGGGLEINPKDVEGDGDIDLLMVSNNYIYVARNQLNWFRERVSELASSLQSYLDQSTPEYDQWNNPMVNVPITVRSEYDATFTLSDLNIQYDYRPTIDITEAVENHMDTAEANETGWVNVPLTMTADDDVTFTVQTTVTYTARPPILQTPIPSTHTVTTNQYAQHLIDLEDYFYDPMETDTDLTYSVTYRENQTALDATIDDHYLDFHAGPHPGSYSFRVQATNEEGYSQESNTFEVEVTPPPPELDLPDEYKLRAQTQDWFDISPYASHYEDKENVSLTTDSEHITAHDNMTLELYYPQQTTETVEVTLTADEEKALDTIQVTATPYSVPLFDPLPDPFLERGENLTRNNSFNLHNYTTHPEENVEDLDYSLLDWDDQQSISLQIEEGWILGWIHEDYHGTSEVTVAVEDPQENSDQATFTLIVNDTKYPPTYLGNIEEHDGTIVGEGQTLRINLSDYFESPGEDLLYQSNKDEIIISSVTGEAEWRPEETFQFSLNRTEYEDTLEEGAIDETLREAFEERDHDIPDGAELHEYDGEYLVLEDDMRLYRIDPEDLDIYEVPNLLDVVFSARLQGYPDLRNESEPIDLFYHRDYLFSLDLTYMEHLEEGPLNETLRQAIEGEGHEVLPEAELREEDDRWFVYEFGRKQYRIEVREESLDVYDEEEPIPYYLGELSHAVVHPNETWSVDLTEHFDYERELVFEASHDEITINDNASWTPDGYEALTGVTFTAYDPEKPHLNVTSAPIDLGPPPEAVITSITPEDPKEGDDIRFEGEADHALGETDYRWKIDGQVYEQKEFNTTLPAGEYEITFEVRDNREEWYGTTRTMNVEEEDEDVLRSFFYSIEFQIALIIILIGVTLNFIGMNVLDRPRKE